MDWYKELINQLHGTVHFRIRAHACKIEMATLDDSVTKSPHVSFY